jgi:hypothetical protein
MAGNPESGGKRPASYWLLTHSPPKKGHSHTIVLLTADLDKTGAGLLKLADRYGIACTKNDGGSPRRRLIFDASPGKAEAFSRDARTMGKLKQYYSNSATEGTFYSEAKEKSALIRAELDGNKQLFEKLPIAAGLMNDLLAAYQAYISGWEAARDTAEITVELRDSGEPRRNGWQEGGYAVEE